MGFSPTNKLFSLFVALALIFIDLATKHLIRLGGGFYVCNKGVAFGIAIPEHVFWLIYGIFFSIALYFFALHLFSIDSPIKHSLSIELIFSGAFSNGIDRFLHGCVTDFISLSGVSFPLFNFADTFLCLGFAYFLYDYLLKSA